MYGDVIGVIRNSVIEGYRFTFSFGNATVLEIPNSRLSKGLCIMCKLRKYDRISVLNGPFIANVLHTQLIILIYLHQYYYNRIKMTPAAIAWAE